MSINTEQLFQAVDIIVKKRIEGLSYDKTQICSIVDDSQSASGRYQVTNGSAIFYAYSENTSYKKDEQVRVTSLEGDATQTKYITGKYIDRTGVAKTTYISPLESVVEMGSQSINQAHGIIPNGDIAEDFIGIIDFTGASWDLQNNSIYDTLTIQAEFRTLLEAYDLREGDFGLKLKVQYSDNKESVVYFNSSEFFGNPYSLITWTKQESKVDITTNANDNITKIEIFLYQSNNFKMGIKNELLVLDENIALKPIQVRNIKIGFGNELTRMSDNTLQIYSHNGNSYSNEIEPAEAEVSLTWYNKDSDAKYIGFSDGQYNIAYDEDNYESFVANYYRLSAQKSDTVPDDIDALELSARMESARSAIARIQTIMESGSGVYGALKYLQSNFERISSSNSIVDFAKDWVAKNKNLVSTIEEAWKVNESYYKNVFARVLGTTTEVVEVPSGFNQLCSADEDASYWNAPFSATNGYDNLIIEANQLWGSLEPTEADLCAGYKNIYMAFCNDLTEILAKIKAECETVYSAAIYTDTTYLDELTNLLNKTSLEPLQEMNTVMYDNQYCLYWYRKNDEEEDVYAGKGWERIQNLRNQGLPEQEQGKENYLPKSKATIKIPLSSQVQKEEIKAILIFNHKKYHSNILTYNNQVDIKEQEIAKKINLSITHGENSRDFYNVYNENKQLINYYDKNITRYLQAKIDSVGTNEEDFKGYHIYWYLPQKNTQLIFISDADEALIKDGVTPEEGMEKEDYYCYWRECNLNESNTLTFPYKINEYYNPTYTDNTILCKVVKNNEVKYESFISLNFGTYGTSGTGYTIVVSANDSCIRGIDSLEYSIKVTDPEGQELSLTDKGGILTEGQAYIEVNLITGANRYELESTYDIENNNLQAVVSLIDGYQGQYYGGILSIKATVYVPSEDKENQTGSYKVLTTKEPLAYSPGTYRLSKGATHVTYDSLGVNPRYAQEPYEITSTDSITWKLVCSDTQNQVVSTELLPTLSKTNILQPLSMYLSGLDDTIIEVQGIYNDGEEEVLEWAQTILITQDKYSSSLLNKWDGSFKQDKDKILATMLGAGRKNSNNTFSGVLMGDVESAINQKDSQLGIFGYHQGALSFGFRTDGTAFLGKSGAGRIEFNGDEGIIQSGKYIPDASGMKINLSTGLIDAYNFKLTSNNILLDANAKDDNPYFKITADTQAENEPVVKKTLIEMSKNSYYIQSANYDGKTQGAKFDLQYGTLNIGSKFIVNAEGQVTASSLSIEGASMIAGWQVREQTLVSGNGAIILDAANSQIILGNNSPQQRASTYMMRSTPTASIQCGNDFSVNQDGAVTANNIKITGNSQASTSTIAGWTIDDNSIRAGELGKANSMWLCRDGTGTSAAKGFVGGETNGWVIAAGKNFGVNNSGQMYSTQATIDAATFTNCTVTSNLTISNNTLTLTDNNNVEGTTTKALPKAGVINFWKADDAGVSDIIGRIVPVQDSSANTRTMLLFEKMLDGRMRFAAPRLEIYPWRTTDLNSDGNKISYMDSTSIDISWENVKSATWNKDFCKMNIKFDIPSFQSNFSLQELISILSDSFEIYYGNSAKIQWVQRSTITDDNYIPILVEIPRNI